MREKRWLARSLCSKVILYSQAVLKLGKRFTKMLNGIEIEDGKVSVTVGHRPKIDNFTFKTP